MPTYEYECSKCGNHFDKFQRMSEDPLKKCPGCGGKIYRLIGSGGGIIFKGSGFYHTDYKNPPAKSRDKHDERKAVQEPCQKPKTEGCKGCSLSKDRDG